jgi:hypothetical protein
MRLPRTLCEIFGHLKNKDRAQEKKTERDKFMDTVMADLFQKSQKPFHEEVIYSEDLQPIFILRKIIEEIINYIITTYVGIDFFIYDDWHSHDGFVNSSKNISTEKLKLIAKTEDAIYNFRQGDFDVYWSIYPANHNFLFRFIVNAKDEDENYPGIWGKFDYSGDRNEISKIIKKIKINENNKILREKSVDYFRRTYAG